MRTGGTAGRRRGSGCARGRRGRLGRGVLAAIGQMIGRGVRRGVGAARPWCGGEGEPEDGGGGLSPGLGVEGCGGAQELDEAGQGGGGVEGGDGLDALTLEGSEGVEQVRGGREGGPREDVDEGEGAAGRELGEGDGLIEEVGQEPGGALGGGIEQVRGKGCERGGAHARTILGGFAAASGECAVSAFWRTEPSIGGKIPVGGGRGEGGPGGGGSGRCRLGGCCDCAYWPALGCG